MSDRNGAGVIEAQDDEDEGNDRTGNAIESTNDNEY